MTRREEVAKKLREVCKVNTNWSMTIHAAFFKISDIISGQYKTYDAFFNRLADLIDPTCTPEEDGYNIVCSECEADIYDDDLYCPHCGARVVRDEA